MNSRKTLNRRMFLRGLGGVAVALPLLESLLPRTVAAQSTAASKRLVVFFTCNGVNRARFFPTTEMGSPLTAASFTGTALEPVADYAGKLLVPRGISQAPEGYGREGNGCDHAKGMGTKLTAQDLQDTDDRYARGISVDQAIAAAVNPGGREAMTLQVGRRGSGVLAHISYRGAGEPVTGENNPWLAYRDFMGMGDTTDPGNQEAAFRIANRRQSVLDIVRSDFESLKAAGLGKADRDKLDAHFQTIREIEGSMTGGGPSPVACNLPALTETELMNIDPETVEDEVNYKHMGKLLLDVMALALACGHTKVASIQWGTGSGGPIFKWDGMNHEVNHHKLSHGSFFDDCFPGDTREKCASEPVGWEESLFQIDRWHAGQFKYLLDKLNAYEEGSGSVLDNSMVMWLNELSDGRAHSWYDLPTVIAGSAGGYLKQAQHIDLSEGEGVENFTAKKAPHNRLLITAMKAMGLANEQFGDPAFAPETGEFSLLRA